MKSYPHIISKLWYEPLVITRAKHAAIWQVLDSRMGSEMMANSEEAEPPKLSDDEQMESNGYGLYGDTAIIRVEGPIGKHLSSMEMMSGGGCDLDNIDNSIELALHDASVARIVFDFRSPGGAVTGIPETGRKIAAIRGKTTIAFTDSECCSGALWLATQCQGFYCTPSASVGSIGVWCAYLDLSRAMANGGENIQEFSAGKYKTMGAYWKPLTSEEAGIVQASVEKIYGQFKEAVNLNREVSDEFMQGQVFDGDEALAVGLVDGLYEDLGQVLDEEM